MAGKDIASLNPADRALLVQALVDAGVGPALGLDSRPTVTLLSHAFRTGPWMLVRKGRLQLQVSSGPDGQWGTGRVWPEYRTVASGGALEPKDKPAKPPFTRNGSVSITLMEDCFVRMCVGGSCMGIHARIGSRSKNLMPTRYFRDIRNVGVTATEFDDADSAKLTVGPMKFFQATVGKRHSMMALFDEDTGERLAQIRSCIVPGDVPGKYAHNQRSELKAEIKYGVGAAGFIYTVPFGTPYWQRRTAIWEPSDPWTGDFHIWSQMHGTEDQGATPDNYMPPYAFNDGNMDGNGVKSLGWATRHDPAKQQTTPVNQRTHFNCPLVEGVEYDITERFVFDPVGNAASYTLWVQQRGGPLAPGTNATLSNPTWDSTRDWDVATKGVFRLGYNDDQGPHPAMCQYQGDIGDVNGSSLHTPETAIIAVQIANPEFELGDGGLIQGRINNRLATPLPAEEQFYANAF